MFLGLIQACFGEVRAIMLRNEWNEWRGIDPESGQARVLAAMEKWFARMWNISEFMRGLKQAFSPWYNAAYERGGCVVGRKGCLCRGICEGLGELCDLDFPTSWSSCARRSRSRAGGR